MRVCVEMVEEQLPFMHHKMAFQTHRIQVHDQIYEAFVHPGSHQVELQFPDSDAPCPLSKHWLYHVNSAYPVQNSHKKTTNAQIFIVKAAFKAYPQTEHVVLFTNDPSAIQPTESLAKLGHNIRNDDIFYPKGTNVNFVCSQQAHHIQLETYERGLKISPLHVEQVPSQVHCLCIFIRTEKLVRIYTR